MKTDDVVGIVMLSYNRSDVVIQCLQSLVLAKNFNVKVKLFLLDNGSQEKEYLAIENQFNKMKQNNAIDSTLIRLSYNSGYPAGNNKGIKYFLDDEEITHICLLNSDVIVTDYWLDNLIGQNEHAIGPVTNACGNEQTIPIPFTMEIKEDSFKKVNEFASHRKNLFHGLKKYTNFLGFFCFVGSKELFQKIGFLDEGFGRGAFEDDDFCIRVLQYGYKLAILRDTFIFHFGSASFSQIPHKVLFKHLYRNRKLFEQKYKIVWQSRDMLPYLGFKQDMDFLFKNRVNPDMMQEIFITYYDNLGLLLQSMFNERRSLAHGFSVKLLLKRAKRKILDKLCLS